ncbi:hypothetical protein [uncultured Amnibacterium sp.]|uniref:hypothetical protein n=1 Tax=uncultured Amnibacterium sp. TaxID=1631851 RepID=UPI0035CB4B2F
MTYRVVIPRSIPFADSNRVQREVWRRGYSTRLAGRDVAQPDHLVVEFLRVVDELPEPAEVPALERDLEQLLSGTRIHAPFMGRGGWVETVQRPLARGHVA